MSLLKALVVLAVLTGCVAHAGTLTVSNDTGGNVLKYARMTHQHRLNGTRVRFTGMCSSACTVLLSLPNEHLCVTPGAYFQFHQAYTLEGGRQVPHTGATLWMFAQYPRWVREWLVTNHGGVPTRIVTMGYDYASRYIREC